MDRYKLFIKLPLVLPDLNSPRKSPKKSLRLSKKQSPKNSQPKILKKMNLKENVAPAVITHDQKPKSIEVKPRENLSSLKSMKIISLTPVPESSKNIYDLFRTTHQKAHGSDLLYEFGNLKIPKTLQIFDRDSLELFKNRFKCIRSSSHTRKNEEKLLYKHEAFCPETLKDKSLRSFNHKKRKMIII